MVRDYTHRSIEPDRDALRPLPELLSKPVEPFVFWTTPSVWSCDSNGEGIKRCNHLPRRLHRFLRSSSRISFAFAGTHS
jgi:hypothetical protein